MAKKNKTLDKIVEFLFPIAGIVFTVTIFAYFWSFLMANKLMVLSVSGGIILLFALMGYFNRKKFIRGFRRRLK